MNRRLVLAQRTHKYTSATVFAAVSYIISMISIYKHIRLLPQYARLALRRESEYKVAFYTFIVHQLTTVLIWLIFWRAILARLGDFGVWNFPLMVLLTGFVTVNMGLWLTFSGIWRLPQEIITGALNNHLIKPVHPFLHFLLCRLNLRSLPRIGIGIAVIVIGLTVYDVPYHPASLLLAGLISMISFLTTILPFALICITAFWIGRADFLRDLFIELFVFQNYPLSEFPRGFKFVFTFIVPLIFSATMPVLVLTRLSLPYSLALLALLLVITGLQILLFTLLWKRGLRRYESFGG